jgi:hypothetical protein
MLYFMMLRSQRKHSDLFSGAVTHFKFSGLISNSLSIALYSIFHLFPLHSCAATQIKMATHVYLKGHQLLLLEV